jgi:hypothetical protein
LEIWLNLLNDYHLEISYLLGNWEIVYACQPDERSIPIAQFGSLFSNFGSVVYLC